jgi:hypothetical protein
MRMFLPAFAIFALAATPAIAQTVSSQMAPEAKVKTVKKKVCQTIKADRDTGSRLGSSTKVCKIVEVPADETDVKAQKTQPQGHNAHAH